MSLFKGTYQVNGEPVYIWQSHDSFWHVANHNYVTARPFELHFKHLSLSRAMNLYFNV